MEEGCFGTSIATSPGREYALEVCGRGTAPSVGVGWKRGGTWDWSIPGATFRLGEPDGDGWRRTFGVVRVPDGADELVLMLGVRQATGERTWFDNAALYSLDAP